MERLTPQERVAKRKADMLAAMEEEKRKAREVLAEKQRQLHALELEEAALRRKETARRRFVVGRLVEASGLLWESDARLTQMLELGRKAVEREGGE